MAWTRIARRARAIGVAGVTATLIPEARAWLDSTNKAMAGGHCFGLSVLAELLWLKQVNASTLGATAYTLTI
jgi:hypothetical protein